MVEYIHGMDEIRVRFSAGPFYNFFNKEVLGVKKPEIAFSSKKSKIFGASKNFIL